MRRLTLSGSLLLASLAALAASATFGTATSLATSCFPTAFVGDGAFNEAACAVGGGTKNYVIAGNTFGWQRLTEPNTYCATVIAGEVSWYEDITCTIRTQGVGKFTEVLAKAGFFWGINPFVGEGKGSQVFTISAGEVLCGEMILGGEAKATKATTQNLTAKYGKCKAFGAAVAVSEASYEFTSEGKLGVGKSITIKAPEAGCTVTIPANAGNKALGKVDYTNTTKGKIVESAKLTGLNYEPSGGTCGSTKLATNGTYSGEAEFEQKGTKIAVEITP